TLPVLHSFPTRRSSDLDWNFFTKSPVSAGQPGGGVANAIVGSGIIVALAGLIGLPVGVGAGLYLAEYGNGRLGWIVRFLADVLRSEEHTSELQSPYDLV